MGTAHLRKKETFVSKPLVVIRNWAIEQVTAVRSVCRPLPAHSGHLR